jgi:hypothetical protein
LTINLNLSRKMILASCKGNVKLLPRFVVVKDEAWPWPDNVRTDSLGRLHLQHTTFMRTVARSVPVKPGLWIAADAQEYVIDLQQHHLEGGDDQQADVTNEDKATTARPFAMKDDQGRYPGDPDYGKTLSDAFGVAQPDLDADHDAIKGPRRGVNSTIFH